MKNIKLILTIAICFIASFSLLLFSPFNLTANASLANLGNYFNTQDNQSRFLTINNLSENLIDSHPENLFTTKATNNSFFVQSAEVKSEYDVENSSVRFYCNRSDSATNKNPRIETAFRLSEKFNLAVSSNKLRVTLKVKIESENGYAEVAFQEGTISSNGDNYKSWTPLKLNEYKSLTNITSINKDADGYYSISFIPTTTDILLIFTNTRNVDTSVVTNGIKIIDPKIELSSVRDNGPEINNVKVELADGDKANSWTNYNKPLNFQVSDNDIGIDRVVIQYEENNKIVEEKINCLGDSNNKTNQNFSYSITSALPKQYKIIAYDVLGGTTIFETKTLPNCENGIGYVDNHEHQDNNGFDDLKINTEKFYHTKNVFLNVTFTPDIKHSLEYIYYTIVVNNSSEDVLENLNQSIIPNPDDITGFTKKVDNINNGNININFNAQTDGKYRLIVLAIDEAGNSKLVNKAFRIDSVESIINVSSYNGTILSVSGAEKVSEGVYKAYRGDVVKLNYSANTNFNFYKVLVNGNDYTGSENSCSYVCEDAKLIDFKILNRFNVQFNPQLNYVFNEKEIFPNYTLNAQDLLNVLTIDELKDILFPLYSNLSDDEKEQVLADRENLTNLSQEELLKLLEQNIIKNVLISIEKDGNKDISIFNVGEYNVTLNILDNSNFYEGAYSYKLFVKPYELQLEGLETNYVYNANVQELIYNKIDNQKINVSIYQEFANIETDDTTEFKNAGNYKVAFSLENSNYIIKNNIYIVSINKKEISVNIEKVEFKYNAKEQEIIYNFNYDVEIYGNIKSIVNYKLKSNNEEILVSSFKNSGDYCFEILPLDNVNFVFSNNVGNCSILSVVANINILKTTYDYTGKQQSLSYAITDDENNEIDINGLQVVFSLNGVEGVTFLEPNTYNYYISTTDDNYVLNGNNWEGEVIIRKTLLKVNLLKSTYEYTGSVINLSYEFLNEDDMVLTELNNVRIEISKEFKNVGLYEFEVIADINYEVIYINKTSLEIIPTIVNLESLQTEYEFSEDGISLNYKLISNLGVDYTGNNLISVIIKRNGNESSLTNTGVYSCEISSSDENIILFDANSENKIIFDINVFAKKVFIVVKDSYEYNGSVINLEYTLSETDFNDFTLVVDELLNAGTYNYYFSSNNENYIIVKENGNEANGQIIVTPKVLEIGDINTNFVYSGTSVNVEFSVNKENLNDIIKNEVSNLTYLKSYKIAGSDNSEIFTNIINANVYEVFITTNNMNYIIDTSGILITIAKKNLDITVTDTIQTYNNQNIEINVETEINGLNIVVKYYASEEEIFNENELSEVINAGTYNYVATIFDSNYTGTISGLLEVNKALINVIIAPEQSKFYGDIAEEYKYSVSGIYEGDDVTVNITREAGETVGLYLFSVEINNANYYINYEDCYFNILPKKLIIIAHDKTITYSENYSEEDRKLTYNAIGLLEGDTLEGELSRTTGDDADSYKINLGTLHNKNYQITFVEANLTIVPKVLDVKINDIITNYGSEVVLSYSVLGEYNPEMISITLDRNGDNNVGTYEIFASKQQSKNYYLNITNGVYEIKPINAQVIPINSQKIYGEQDNLSYSVSGLINNDALKGNLIRTEGENAGEYEILLDELQQRNPNYNLSLVSSNKFIINKASINIVIDDITQIYGESEKELTYSINGLMLNDEIKLNLFRENYENKNAGSYVISCEFTPFKNYVINSLKTGVYTIEKTRVTPVLNDYSVMYNGKEQQFSNTDFPYELKYVYKYNGNVIDRVIDAGVYKVQGYFEGNQNYYSTKSNEVSFTVNKYNICFNLGKNVFTYDGEEKFPEYTFDINCGLTKDSIISEFENNITPKEIGEYKFTIIVDNKNYEGSATGIIKITKSLSLVSDIAIIECDEISNEAGINNLKLVGKNYTGKINNQQILQACSFENIDNVEKGHIFTVRMKAKTDDNKVYVYKIDKDNNATEVVVSVENGFYVFKVDGLDCYYVITKDIEPMSLFAIAGIILVSIIVIVSIMIALKVRKKKRKKLALKLAKNNVSETITINEEKLQNELEGNKPIKKIRVDEVVNNALNNASIKTKENNVNQKNDNINNKN